tara:strand:+ start:219 stop:488 length:270 start_codon:yes stop_codon:yes gene_type:complete
MKKKILLIFIFILTSLSSKSEECNNLIELKTQNQILECLEKNKSLREDKSLDKDLLKKFECLNLCKISVKSNMSLNEINNYCLMKCGLK